MFIMILLRSLGWFNCFLCFGTVKYGLLKELGGKDRYCGWRSEFFNNREEEGVLKVLNGQEKGIIIPLG